MEKTLTEGRRVAYFFQPIGEQHPPPTNSPVRRFDAFNGMFKVNRSLIFYFVKNSWKNGYKNQGFQKQAFLKRHYPA